MFKKIKAVIRAEFSKGLDASGGSRAMASAFTFGIFPILGFSTPLNTLSALLFKLNQPIVQAVNWVLGPLKLVLIFPFLRFGEWIFDAEPFTLSLTEFSSIFFDDWLATTREFAWTFAHVITGWLILAPLIYLLMFSILRALLSKRMRAGVEPDATEVRGQG